MIPEEYQSVIPIGVPPITGGVNNRYGPREIGLSQIADGLNVDLLDPTRPCTRGGLLRTRWGTHGIPSTAMVCAGVGELNVGPSSRLFVAAYPGADGGVYYATTLNEQVATQALVTRGPDGMTFPGKFDPGERCNFRQGNDLLWCLPSGSNVHALSPDGTLTDCGNGRMSPPFAPDDGRYFMERMWFFKKDLFYSKLLPVEGDIAPADAFDRELQKLTMTPERGGESRAMIPWRDESLLCFFVDHTEQVVVNSSTPLLSQRRVVDPLLGTISARTVATRGDEVFFLDQYSRLRALSRTTEGTLRASRPLPLSEGIKSEFPGRCRPENWNKTWLQIHEDRLEVHYCRDDSEQPNAQVNLILTPAYGLETESGLPNGWRWECPWVYAKPLAHGISSNIGGQRYCAYAADGSEDGTHHVYKVGEDERTDDGETIEYLETGRMWAPPDRREWRYVPHRWGLSFNGDVGAYATVSMRTREWDDYSVVGGKAVEDANADLPGTHFPLLFDDSFPLAINADFPLVFEAPKETRLRRLAPEANDPGEIPSGLSDMPHGQPQLPIEGGGLIPHGHGVQYQIRSASHGLRFRRVDLLMELYAHKPQWDEEI